MRKIRAWIDRLFNNNRESRLVQTIDLEKTYVSNIDYGYRVEKILGLQDNDTTEYLFKNSIYVDFLEHIKDKQEISDSQIMETEYYKSSLNTLKTRGICRHVTCESGLLDQCRYFIDLYRAMRSNRYKHDYEKFALLPTQSQDPYPAVFRMEGSHYCMISDGHHRLACSYVLGKRYAKVKVIGVKRRGGN